MSTATIAYKDGYFYVSTEYGSEEMHTLRESIPTTERGWDKERKLWWVTEKAAQALERMAAIHNIEVQDNVATAFQKIALSGVVQETVTDINVRKIDVENDRFTFTFRYSALLVDAIKALTGRTWEPDNKRWTVLVENASEVAYFARAYNFELSDAAHAICVEHEPKQEELDLSELKGTLFKFQEAGVQAILSKKRFLLGDEMGTGKTIQCLAAAHAANAFPCLIVCPKKLVLNWRNEWKQWTNMRVHVVGEKTYGASLYKTGNTLTAADVYIVNYEGLAKVAKVADKFKFVAFDEAHFLKNPQAKRTKLAAAVAEFAEYVVAMTGTPVVNDPKELYTVLKVLQVHRNFPSFFDRYVNSKTKGMKLHESYLKELNMLLNKYCYMRREKKDVLPDLPDKIRQKIYIDMDAQYETLYNKALNDLASFLKRHRGKTDEQIERATKNEALVKINYLKQVAAEAKLAQGIEFAESLIEQGEKIVVFAHHKVIIDKLMAWGAQYGAVKIDGSISDSNIVNNNVQQFQNNSLCKVIVCSLNAAGVGLTLTASSRVLFFEMGWTPAIMSQAEDRCHRNGAKDVVYAYYLLANNTIDDKIYNLIERKRNIADIVAGATNKIETQVIKDLYEYIRDNA